jgi:uncharacterized protein YaiE (UPF0345 family)
MDPYFMAGTLPQFSRGSNPIVAGAVAGRPVDRRRGALASAPAPGTLADAMTALPTQFHGVTVVTKANVYFQGNVTSYTLLLPGDTKKTLGLIRPGSYHFNTDAPERMEIIDGACRVTVDGAKTAAAHAAGEFFDVPGKSGFTIEVASGLCQYICSFLPHAK